MRCAVECEAEKLLKHRLILWHTRYAGSGMPHRTSCPIFYRLRNLICGHQPAVSKRPLEVKMDEFLDNLLLSSSSWPDMSLVQANSIPGVSVDAFQGDLKISPVPGESLQRLVENNVAPVGSPILQLNTTGGSANSEACALGDNSHSPLPIWSQPFVGSSPLSSPLGQVKLEGFPLNRESLHGEGHLLGKRSHPEEKVLVRKLEEHDDIQGTLLTSYAGVQTGQTPQARISGTQSQQQNLRTQSIQTGEGNSSVLQVQSGAGGGNAVNGAGRPRVRARRGQATDPHSIAERLRRERIAERMKSLQELVPNSNKTDKASMLDEIIDYVKFLQLQVKVLSMSRLGGAGAVAPLIADVPHEGPGSLMSTGLGQAGGTLPLSQEGLAFEQEVAKLMESNMTTAMQYLQNKGLCLMPIALASAISSSSGNTMLPTIPGKLVDSSERQNSDMQSSVLPFSSSSTAMGVRTVPSSSEGTVKENSINKDSREEVVSDKLNVVAPIRQSDVAKVISQNREEQTRRGQL